MKILNIKLLGQKESFVQVFSNFDETFNVEVVDIEAKKYFQSLIKEITSHNQTLPQYQVSLKKQMERS